jgi:hypothetical protein
MIALQIRLSCRQTAELFIQEAHDGTFSFLSTRRRFEGRLAGR